MNRREFVRLGAGALAATVGLGNRSRVAAADKARNGPPAARPRSGLLTGSFLFVQHINPWNAAYCDECLTWKAENWRALIRDMHAIGIDTGIWINSAFWGRPLFPGYEKTVGRPLKTMGCEDPLGVVADEADRLGMKLFYGIGFRGRCSQVRDYAGMDKPWPDIWFTWNTAVAAALVERYGSRPSFAGLYVSYEIDYHDLHVELYEKLVKQHLRPAVGNVKLMASPGNIGMEVKDLSKFPKMVERTGINVLAPQDYGGRNADIRKAVDNARRNAQALERVGKTLRDMGVSVWANCELFIHEGTPDGRGAWTAGPFERIRQQIEIQSPVADKLICFIYQGAMNRRTSLVSIGHPSTQRLYDEYTRYLAAEFPGRFTL
jgi:hypothetical protein